MQWPDDVAWELPVVEMSAGSGTLVLRRTLNSWITKADTLCISHIPWIPARPAVGIWAVSCRDSWT